MAQSLSRPLRLQTPLAMLLCLICVVFAAPAIAHDSASSKTDIICHTSNPDECYPRIFEPTDEFQMVHDDQEIPKGLHVRLDMTTGKKEAKINVPDEKMPWLEGQPVDRAMVVVEPEGADPEQPMVPKGAPKYDPVGKVKGPEHEHESGPFYEGLKMLKKAGGTAGGTSGAPGAALDHAMVALEDLAHDLYYGLKIAEDADAVQTLLCLMSSQQKPAHEGAAPRDQQAAVILAGMLQNNPNALGQITKIWPELAQAKCPDTGHDSLRISLYSSVLPSHDDDDGTAHQAAARVKPKVVVMNGLIKDSSIRAEFLEQGGMSHLLSILLRRGEAWASAQRRVGELVLDNFLDEDMGAVLGQWPRTPRVDDAACQADEARRAEGCWDYHIARIARGASGGDWSRELGDRLAAVRAGRSLKGWQRGTEEERNEL